VHAAIDESPSWNVWKQCGPERHAHNACSSIQKPVDFFERMDIGSRRGAGRLDLLTVSHQPLPRHPIHLNRRAGEADKAADDPP
jgi:hypothetical protein